MEVTDYEQQIVELASRIGKAAGGQLRPGKHVVARILSVIAGSSVEYVTARLRPVDEGLQGEVLLFTPDELVIVELAAEMVAGERGSKADLTMISRRTLTRLTLAGEEGDERDRWDDTYRDFRGWGAAAKLVAHYEPLDRVLELPLADGAMTDDNEQAWLEFLPSLREDLSRS